MNEILQVNTFCLKQPLENETERYSCPHRTFEHAMGKGLCKLSYYSREHDKNPDLFFKTLLQLKSEGLDFRLSVLGESYTDVPGGSS